ncbi:NADPH:quinone oxidoreductase [Burkholderia singularis]|uniref:NADPH:quinone oxidoreductase n=1 Tax=Burkholderia singularis TaxID=1503053 RepID=A0A124P8M1_9BURK|nr:NADPH:quinone oxidoreductase family protein [Burkholderia singularis]KVE25792.1 NADPH:quinone oxidoreductase [Burkholderia singularis]
MRAIVCETFGPPSSLRVAELPSPEPGPKQIVVTTKVASVNFPDALIIEGKYQFKPEPPFVPGCELAGIVKAVGAGVARVKPGDAVAAIVPTGGYAQEILLAEHDAIPLPPELSEQELESAASFMLTYGTSYHALKDRAKLQAGETLLVLGAAGGVGLAAVELGKLLGARVIAAASSDDKLAVARRHGADETINYAAEDLRARLKALCPTGGVDVVYDPVGGDLAEPALRSVGWNGRYLVVGFAAGQIPKLPLNLTLLKGSAIVGVFWGEFTRREPQRNIENVKQLFAWLREAKLHPFVSARYPLSQAPRALEAMLARQVTGKIVILPQQVE